VRVERASLGQGFPKLGERRLIARTLFSRAEEVAYLPMATSRPAPAMKPRMTDSET
jgi:hypothetical protein